MKKTALVTGGSSGLGLAMAQNLAKQGYKPTVLERGYDVDRRTIKVDEFWKYCHLPIDQLWIELGDDTIPKRVMSKSGEINKLEKLIWIVRNKKFGFMKEIM